MRHLLLAVPLTLLAFSNVYADEHNHDHGSLAKHQHGIASINVALDGDKLEITLESPTMNIVGFEHAATSAADQATVSAAKAVLEQPLQLFALPASAGCAVTRAKVESALFQPADANSPAAHDEGEVHSDIDADYQLTCSNPADLTSISLAPLFKQFSGTQKITVQLIGPNGQEGAELTPAAAAMNF